MRQQSAVAGRRKCQSAFAVSAHHASLFPQCTERTHNQAMVQYQQFVLRVLSPNMTKGFHLNFILVLQSITLESDCTRGC